VLLSWCRQKNFKKVLDNGINISTFAIPNNEGAFTGRYRQAITKIERMCFETDFRIIRPGRN
jgi:hypothetical protein